MLAGAAAAEPVVSIHSGALSGRAYVERSWAQVEAWVTNERDEDLELTMVVLVPENARRNRFVRSVYVPARSERKVWMRARLADSNNYQLSLLNAAGETLSVGAVIVPSLSWDRFLVFSAGDSRRLPSIGRDTWRASIKRDGPVPLSLALGQPVEAASANLFWRDLPDQWGGFGAAEAVMLGSPPPGGLRPRQVHALEELVEAGGLVLFCPDDGGYKGLDDPLLDRLLPVRPFGVRRQAHLALSRGEQSWEVPLQDGVDLIESEPVEGAEVVYWAGGVPAVVRKRIGAGEVCFLAFPGSALGRWGGAAGLMADLLRHRSRPRPFDDTGLRISGPEVLGQVAGGRVAPPGFVLGTLGGYLVLVAFMLWWMRRKGRTELAWAVILPAGLLIAFISYRVGLGYQEKIGLSLNEFGMGFGAAGSRGALRTGLVGLHSPTEVKGVLTSGSADTLLSSGHDPAHSMNVFGIETFKTEPVLEVVGYSAEPGQMTLYRVESLVDLGGSVQADLQLGPDGVSGSITNGMTRGLEHAMVVVNGYPFALGDFAPNQGRKVELTEGHSGARNDFASAGVMGTQAQLLRGVVSALHIRYANRPQVPWIRNPHLVGWSGRPMVGERFRPEGEESVYIRSAGILLMELPVRPADAGTRVSVPRAFVPIGILNPLRGNFAAIDPSEALGRDIALGLFLPEFAGNVSVERAQLSLSCRARGLEVALMGRDMRTRALVPIDSAVDPGQKWNVTVTDPGRFFDDRIKAVILQLRVRPKGEQNGGAGAREPEQMWHLLDASAVLEGTAH